MILYYLFLANTPLKRSFFEEAISSVSEEKLDFHYFNSQKGYFLADEKLSSTLQQVLFNIHDDLGVNLTIVVSHCLGEFEEKMLKESISYFPNQCLFLTDMLLKELSFGDYSSIPLLANEFKKVSPDLLLTAGTFLRCGLNASLSAETLFIHRNTFNYRLNSFIEETSLDIRSYHNALLLELYFQFTNKR
ncbi:MAG: helix-turn-helix domain-containing protein [Mollicutes bacterium]|nr:helix-turn-helix domain-containing protein [Mollicutes bacterium]MDD7042786.1 helix-turn-helix domain-containing protein [Mollicutes bacterium]MDY6070483.1 helix-turn-helix domain-containing protein [Bacilli bacterium]